MAHEALAYGDWDAALALAQRAMTQAPSLSERATVLMAQAQMATGHPDEVIQLLEGAAFTDPDLKASRLYLLASAYREKEDWEKALQAQNDLLPLAEGLSAWIHELNGDVYVRRDEPDLAVEEYRLAMESSPADERRRLLEKIADVQVRSGEVAEALDTYAEVLSMAEEPALIARVHYLRGLALREMGEEEAALEAFGEAVQATPYAHEAYLALVELVNAEVPVDEFRRGLINYYNGVYQAAIQAFQRYLQGEDAPRASEAIQYIADAYLSLGQHEEALDVLQQAAAAETDVSLKAEILMAEGRVLYQAGQLSEAREAYLDAAAACPACAVAPEAMWRSAETALAAGDRAGAASDFLNLQRNYPEDDGADDAMLRAALIYYLDRRYGEAAQACRELLSRYPDSQRANAAHFWAGKAAIREQEWDDAEQHLHAADAALPDYYSVRAAALLRGETSVAQSTGNVLFESDSSQYRDACLAWLLEWAADGATYNFDALPEDMLANPDYIQGEAFAALGLPREAAEHFAQVRALWREEPLALFVLAERLRDLGLYRESIACAERVIALSPTGSAAHAPRYLQRLAYPAPYTDEILAQAGAQGLDPLLLLALIRQESRFDPLAGSWAGALGLMQVTPPTGEWIALQLGVRDYEKADLYRASVNLRFGTWYLARQLKDFGGEVAVALAAYNGGPGYARLWLSGLDEYDPDLFVEFIPVAETQLYVKTITEQWDIYRRIYQPATALSP